MASESDDSKQNILIVCSNCEKDMNCQVIMDIENIFNEKYNIYIGSPLGGIIQMNHENFRDKNNSERKSVPFDLLDPAKFKALIIPSMYGGLIDLSNNQRLGYIINEMNKAKRILCFVGFGVCGLLSVRVSDGVWPFEGCSLTGPTLFEEINSKPPEFAAPALYIESYLRSNGAEYCSSKDQPCIGNHVVVCSNLITAQNHHSYHLALSIVKLLLDV